jgi:hypothetical protein
LTLRGLHAKMDKMLYAQLANASKVELDIWYVDIGHQRIEEIPITTLRLK